MLTEQRKNYLLALLKKEGRLVAKSLSDDLGVSEDTIRRDLRELAADGLLLRVHGGALPASPTTANLDIRRTLATVEKTALAAKAATLVTPHQRIFIDGGTTHLEVVRQLPLNWEGTIITHSPLIAAALEHHSAEVIVIGGQLFKHSMINKGAATLDAIQRIRVDLAFIGLTGLHEHEGGTTGDFEEAEIKRSIMSRAAEVVILLTQEKIGAASAYTVCGLKDISTAIVSKNLNTAALETQGLRILRAG
jgi:DeoR/GlpR family transcriptional regulator of sugar metabolism